jgi:acyl-CoA dehydrogenase
MTEDVQDLVAATIRNILKDHKGFARRDEADWDSHLWDTLARAGMTGVGLSENAGGSGGSILDAVTIVSELAREMAVVPVAEHLLVALPAIRIGGLPFPRLDQPLTIALAGVSAAKQAGSWSISGRSEVPWAAASNAIAVVAVGPGGPLLTVVPTAHVSIDVRANIAGEPRGTVTFDCVRVSSVAALTTDQVEELQARYAICRAAQLSAALDQILTWSVQFVGERHQFGRPLGRFQAIQMNLAQMAGEVSAVQTLVGAAVRALEKDSGNLLLIAAATKVRAGSAVEVVARLAHQVHGALGFTQEYRLHHLTTRCWSWRDEAGSESAWSQVLGSGLLDNGEDGLWAALTRVV